MRLWLWLVVGLPPSNAKEVFIFLVGVKVLEVMGKE
jgi:hypothetical protein